MRPGHRDGNPNRQVIRSPRPRKAAPVAILIDDLITSIEVELEAAERTASKAANEVKFILKRASDEGRANLAADEDVRVQDLFAARDRAKADIKGIQAKLESARKAKAEEVEEREAAREVHETGVPRPRTNRQQATVTVGRNERTYRPDTDRKGTQFLRDVSRAFIFNDAEAQFRLSQHMQEERVERGAQMMERAAGDSTTANWAGLTVPQYLTDMYAPAVAALRPFADICNHHDLPASGMTVNISQVTTASSVALQATEIPAGGVSATSIDDTLLTENVQTAAGQVTLSRQAIDRGTGIEEVTMQDLYRRYATTLDNTLITQATTGLQALSTLITFTSPVTAAGMYPKILGAAAGVEAALLAQATPSHAVMHSRRWYWLASQLGSTWPLINSFGPQDLPQQGGLMNPDSSYSRGVRGLLPSGLKVVVDNNIATNLGVGTNQDQAYVVAADECHLWESPDAPVYIRAEQPKAASLGVLLVLYGYFAYTFRRYANAVQAVDGAGMVTPAF
jgi:hypothetical protein